MDKWQIAGSPVLFWLVVALVIIAIIYLLRRI